MIVQLLISFIFNAWGQKVSTFNILIHVTKFFFITEQIVLKLQKYSGDEVNDQANKNINETEPAIKNQTVCNDLEFTKNETIHLSDVDGVEFQIICGHIKETERFTQEDPSLRQEEDVCVLWNHIPDEISLDKSASTVSYKFVMAVDTTETDVKQEIIDGELNYKKIFKLFSF